MADPQMPESSPPDAPGTTPATATTTAAAPAVPPPSFVKLAMRNMVRKGRQSLLHFGLTAVGLSSLLLLLAWFGRPTLPQ
ncbi:DUF3285 domain-containing protein [Synechococcus sp. L2F]|uniref:DUF3285 domain-containing protein n=1 Tax=Synechococcus sp. L2F TaxID=2823739 RepID=UPI0020CF5A29|nr:DUF3285 domain-containing protein [Synechococcus sp. L2F]